MTTSPHEAPLVARCGHLEVFLWRGHLGSETELGVGGHSTQLCELAQGFAVLVAEE